MARIRLEGVTKRFGEKTALAGVDLDIADGSFFTILGPPGAGKTTTLRTILGLERPEEGDVYMDDDRVTDVWPGDRDMAIVFQNLALYPDKTVRDNLAFPLKQRKLPGTEITSRIDAVAKLLRIERLLERKPAKLSGGERQRVALGRALVRDPKAYLLDEPISALDALLRLEMRTELKRLQQELGKTMVYVTHDQVEAMTMADTVGVLREGVVQQVAPPEDIYHRPANRFVATVVGQPPMNFLPAVARRVDGVVAAVHPDLTVAAPAGRDTGLEDGAACWIGVRPEDLHLTGDGGVAASVVGVEPLGAETVIDADVGGRLMKVVAPPNTRVATGDAIRLAPDPRRLHLFDADDASVASPAGDYAFDVTT